MQPFSYEVLHKDEGSSARLGVLHTAHGDIPTPVFMPVGTAGAVKAMPAEWLEDLERGIILANTYHLYLRPGHERIAETRRTASIHVMETGDTDRQRRLSGVQPQGVAPNQEEGVHFRSHLDGSLTFPDAGEGYRYPARTGIGYRHGV